MTQLEKSPPGTVLEGEASLRELGERLQGAGYAGDAVERELAALILRAVRVKSAKLNKPHFQAADCYSLLIYDNSHLASMADLGDLAAILRDLLLANDPVGPGPKYFSEISVLSGSWLLYDAAGQASLLPAEKT